MLCYDDPGGEQLTRGERGGRATGDELASPAARPRGGVRETRDGGGRGEEQGGEETRPSQEEDQAEGGFA